MFIKKTITIIMVLILAIMGMQASAQTHPNNTTISENLKFNIPNLQSDSDYTEINYPEADSWLTSYNQPMLPVIIKSFSFPFKTKYSDIKVTFSKPIHKTLQQPLRPSPHPRIKSMKDQTFSRVSINNYEIYPKNEYVHTITTGLIDGKISSIITFYLYPIKYLEQNQKLIIRMDATIQFTLSPPEHPLNFPEDLDLLIISTEKFESELQQLKDHKNNYGVNTTLITVESIDSTYPGDDLPEKMKNCIKNNLETHGIKYVLLFGGLKGQTRQWHVPVRYAHLDDQSNFETSFISDLYYADIYDGEGNFSEWDPNNNGRYAEWNDHEKEIIDFVPDISVGRLPCRNKAEAKLMVNKIITYETTTFGQPWFNRMVTVGGDSAPGYEYYEGEEENKQALLYMQGFEGTTLWTSDNTFNGPDDVITAISEGCGFLFFDGHGNPSTWSTHPPDDKKTWITGLDLKHMPQLKNDEKTPITVIGGCHNGQFNVSLQNIPHDWLRLIQKFVAQEGLIKGMINGTIRYWRNRFYYMEWVPECWAWRLTRKIGGGGIAVMAYTGLDWFAEGDYNGDDIPDCIQFFSGYANTHFFKNYGVNNITILGDAHMQTLIDYIQAFPPMNERLDCKTVEEFVLLGDPSLQIGGYP